MAGEIKHEWNGTTLTITSDSGTSSMDLKGDKGDVGIRGPQGRAGVILNDDGSIDMNGYATEAYVLDAIEIALEDYTPSGGGGGGTGGGGGGVTNNAELTVKSTTGWTYKTIADSGTCTITGEWSSIEEDLPTGSGTLTLYVDNAIKLTKNIPQGPFGIDVTKYLDAGNNTVQIKITDIYGNSRKLAFTVNKVSLTIESTFDPTLAYTTNITYTYVATGNVAKTVHFKLNNVEIGSQEVTTSGRQQSFTIAKKPHGSYFFEVYFTAEIDGEEVESNHLYYDIIFTSVSNNTPIISCAYQGKDIVQFETINIPYVVYSPASLTSKVVLAAEGETVQELTVDRKQQTWSYRVDYFGEVTLTISCGEVVKTITLNVEESPIQVDPVEDSLELFLSSYGRSNKEANPASWEFGDIKCQFSNYNWVSDGWLTDEGGITVHRVSGDARLRIPLKIFKDDFRTFGKTLEFDFRTRDVRNYDAEVISCYSGDVGFKLTAQMAMLKSEQTEVFTQYKENEQMRISFVVQKRAENRLVFIYLNGIMCGCVQYPADDNFSQANAVDILIGSNDCTVDLYTIRVYNNSLTHFQILDNWIADTQDIALRADRYARNNVCDAYGNIVIENLPATLPYMILRCPQLPQYKGNKVTMDGEFVDPVHPNKSFTFAMAEGDVQGTSSAGYARKNYKLKLKNGLMQNGVLKEKYQMRDGGLEASVFCFKADVASSEGCNNVELVRQYNDVCPYKTPAQTRNPAYRQGIDGFPMVIFHDNGTETKFIGRYNFNFDKSSGHWGFGDGDESWEVKNNTSDRVIWKNADFNGDDWKNDFESMYPDDYEDTRTLKAFAQWVVSTDRDAATNVTFETPITVNGVVFNADTAEYRLAKFRHELPSHAEVESAIFFYIMTTLYLAIDNRAKNTFPSWQGGSKVYWIAYDWDSCIGIDNVGSLKFGYELEDFDILDSGATPYNGQDSVFWCNLRDTYAAEIKAMYQELRSTDKLSYEKTEKAFREHQAVWPEIIWNMDQYYKYIEPLIEDGAGIYLPMLHGSKSEQRKWWLYNRYRYIDSKWNAGDAQKDFITLRGYAKSNITVEPYADIYASIKYGSYLVQERALRGSKYTLACPLDNVNDTEIYIYSASQLKDIGDLSGLKVGLADFSMADKIQSIKVGDGASTYSNGNLKTLTLGNNVLLKTIDARNCVALGTGEQQSIDISGCKNVESVYLTGTAIKGITLPDGGVLKTLHLPDTIANLTICNQTALTDFVLNNPSSITTLRLENMDDVIPAQRIVESMANGGRIRIIGTTMTLTGAEVAVGFFDKLATMRGLDENGNNVDVAQISGRFRVSSDCEPYIAEWQARYPDVVFDIWTPVMEETSWAQISELAERGIIDRFFPVGSEKTITLTTGEVVTAVILGFNHDRVEYSSTGAKAAISFGLKDCVETSNTSGFSYSGYGGSALKNHIDSYFDLLPGDLQNLIKPVYKGYRYYSEDSWTGVWSSRSSSSQCKLWAFSGLEIMGTYYYNEAHTRRCDSEGGTQYAYFAEAEIPEGMTPLTEGATTGTYIDANGVYYNTRAIKQMGNTSIQNAAYKTRSLTQRNDGANAYAPSVSAWYITTAGGAYYNAGSSGSGVCFGFCI